MQTSADNRLLNHSSRKALVSRPITGAILNWSFFGHFRAFLFLAILAIFGHFWPFWPFLAILVVLAILAIWGAFWSPTFFNLVMLRSSHSFKHLFMVRPVERTSGGRLLPNCNLSHASPPCTADHVSLAWRVKARAGMLPTRAFIHHRPAYSTPAACFQCDKHQTKQQVREWGDENGNKRGRKGEPGREDEVQHRENRGLQNEEQCCSCENFVPVKDVVPKWECHFQRNTFIYGAKTAFIHHQMWFFVVICGDSWHKFMRNPALLKK